MFTNFFQRIRNNLHIVIFTMMILFVSLPLFKYGYFSHQDDLHIIRLYEMRQCIESMQIPCRWVSNMGYGNGFPMFNYYAPSIYYLGVILTYIVGYINTAKVIFFLSLSLGSFGIYLFVKHVFDKQSAFISSVLYLLAPYKALDIYVRGALSEAFSLAIIPFVFYFLTKIIDGPIKKKDFLLFTLSLFLFLITHNIMILVFAPVLLVWALLRLYLNNFSNLKLVILGGFISFLLSSFFLLPAYFEKDLIQTDSLTRFELDFRANFVSLYKIFIDRSWGYGTSIPGPLGGMSFQVGIFHWILSFISILILFKKNVSKGLKMIVSLFVIFFVTSVFMMHVRSSFVWESIKILSYFQFPWRFLSLSIFTSSVLGGLVLYLVKDKYKNILIIAITLLTFILNYSYFKPLEQIKINDEQKLSGQSYEIQIKGSLLDYLPKTALEPREKALSMPLITRGSAIIESFEKKSDKFNGSINVLEDQTVLEFPIFYFPNWQVFVNGKKSDISYDNYIGRIAIRLDKGEYQIAGKLKNTPIRTVSNTLTAVGFFSLLIVIKKWKK